jgi:hypothetical protein
MMLELSEEIQTLWDELERELDTVSPFAAKQLREQLDQRLYRMHLLIVSMQRAPVTRADVAFPLGS